MGLYDSVLGLLNQAGGTKKKKKIKKPEPFGPAFKQAKKAEEDRKKKLRKKASQPDKQPWLHH